MFVSSELTNVLNVPYREDLPCGAVAIQLDATGHYLMLFRAELPQSVTWAGKPEKPQETDPVTGERRLTPRGSFETWLQDVRGKSEPWTRAEIETFNAIARAIVMRIERGALALKPSQSP